ncbi:MAG: peptidyl-prolyl cis-trans isomerase [Candidatus Omnitrophica bacterium]|nr:peptidyl-prolyl cis-trans isomerase [Candidatus Omnitrophota bacterium]MCM8808764.1 peptidyl-prolyl cis-trans isomerase [Candidatus Omnitrophota bacterium]
MKIKLFYRKWKGIIGFFILSFLILGIVIFLIVREQRNTIAVVNGYKIKFDEIITKIELSPEIYKEYFFIDPKSIIDDYVNQVLLFQYAKKFERKLRKKVEGRIKNYYMEILTQQFVEDILSDKIKISDEEISDYYNKHLQEFVIPEKVQISEIVVDSKEKADEILNRLKIGESFEKIAETESIAPTREKRGEIGWIEVDKLNPEVISLINQMKPGEILANIIKTEMGYHIIKLTGRTEKRILSLPEATPMIKNLLLSQKKKVEVDNLLKKLKEKSKIEIYPNKIEILKGKIK